MPPVLVMIDAFADLRPLLDGVAQPHPDIGRKLPVRLARFACSHLRKLDRPTSGRWCLRLGRCGRLGWGGVEAVAEWRARTIGRGLKDLDAAPLLKGRVPEWVAAGELCRAGARSDR